jgi:hypothetical protein
MTCLRVALALSLVACSSKSTDAPQNGSSTNPGSGSGTATPGSGSATGPKLSADAQAALSMYQGLTDQMCKCKDAACAEGVSKDLTDRFKPSAAVMDEIVKLPGASGTGPFRAAQEEMAKCMAAAGFPAKAGSGSGSAVAAGSGSGSGSGSAEPDDGFHFDIKTTLAGDKTFEQLADDDQVKFMKENVVPQMKAEFQAFDGKKFANFGCKTCHGKDFKEKKYKMPNPDLPKLDFAKLREGKQEPKMAAFMMHHTSPDMAKILNLPPYDPKTNQGFGCLECHEQKK